MLKIYFILEKVKDIDQSSYVLGLKPLARELIYRVWDEIKLSPNALYTKHLPRDSATRQPTDIGHVISLSRSWGCGVHPCPIQCAREQ